MEISTKTKTIILLIVAIIIAFSFIGSSANEIIKGSRSVTEANNCIDLTPDTTGARLFYNRTDGYCWNSTDKQVLATRYQLPLNGLFGENGVMLLVMMASILIGLIFFSLRYIKRK